MALTILNIPGGIDFPMDDVIFITVTSDLTLSDPGDGVAGILITATFGETSEVIYDSRSFSPGFAGGYRGADTPGKDEWTINFTRDNGWKIASFVVEVEATEVDVTGGGVMTRAHDKTDYVTSDGAMPEVTTIVPTPSAAPGAGGFSADGATARVEPITFRVRNAGAYAPENSYYVVIMLKYVGASEMLVVYNGSVFVDPFSERSTVTPVARAGGGGGLLADDLDFSILPSLGWRKDIESLQVLVIDNEGNVTNLDPTGGGEF